MLDVGDKIPLEISLFDENEKEVTLKQYLGQPLVIYFYPEDDTPSCTKEACEFRDFNKDIESLGVKIIGISRDSVKSHNKFKDKYKLNFELLSDPEHKLMEAFGSWGLKVMMGREFVGTIRCTFIVNSDGEIIKVWKKVQSGGHAKRVFDELKGLIKT